MRWLLDPRVWMVFHAVLALQWVALFPLGMTVWRDSLPFLQYVSLMTAAATSLAGFGAALAAWIARNNGTGDGQ